ncbi:hypothetical protein [Thiomicrospira sp. WB1]|uniref:hypothetical protein n=1 Tax=Thiomicrospira sp. WB1 TaxID=1685380 RepID=UPI000746EAB2|nr:hypothetical protein [Thiomicrospira sp. WB1]KUJ72317.1 hypothetical protein AVO41_00420 [Thiomicrospira sp. WB1]
MGADMAETQSWWAALALTPWWVWGLLAVALWLSVRGLKTRVVALWQLPIWPLLLMAVAADQLVTSVPADMTGSIGLLIAMALAWLLGSAAGMLLVARLSLHLDPAHHLIEIPGSAFRLGVTLLLLGFKWLWLWQASLAPLSLLQPGMIWASVFFNVTLMGLVFGWGMTFYLRLRHVQKYGPDDDDSV